MTADTSITVTTNNVPRLILEPYELTTSERRLFPYLDWEALEEGRESASFFRYRGEVYDLAEFMVWDNPSSPTRLGWNGFQSDTFFSGIVVKYCDDHDHVIVGRYYAG